MPPATKTRSPFGEQLRLELDRQNLSLRGFAKRLNPDEPQFARRALQKWLAGAHHPTRKNRIAVAEALGLHPSFFEGDDDEEDEPVVDILLELVYRVQALERRRAYQEVLA